MKNENGFSLVELLIVVAIIAIIAAIAVPSLLTSKMAANESAGIQGCRTIGSAEIAFAATNNQQYTDIPTLIAQNFLDNRFATGINGYRYAGVSITPLNGVAFNVAVAGGSSEFSFTGTPDAGMGRYVYGIGPDQVVRYISTQAGYTAPLNMQAGQGIGAANAAGS